MNLIIIHRDSCDGAGSELLRFALATEPVAGLVLDGLSGCLRAGGEGIRVRGLSRRPRFGQAIYAIPEEWKTEPRTSPDRRSSCDARPNVTYYRENVPVPCELPVGAASTRSLGRWFVVSNGRFATRMGTDLLESVLAGVQADVVAITVDPELLAEREKVRLTTQGKVAGFRRLYADSAEFAFTSADWPHHLFINSSVLARTLTGGAFPESFPAVARLCRAEGLRLHAISVGGTVLDLQTEEGLLGVCGARLSTGHKSSLQAAEPNKVFGNPRIVGHVLLGNNISAGSGAVIIGPAIIGDNVTIEPGAIIHSSIIGPGSCLPTNQLVRDCVVRGPQHDWRRSARNHTGHSEQASRRGCNVSLQQEAYGPFRRWGRLSYARCLKRVTDCLVAGAMLVLFAPLMPFVALAIKLTSPGPIFYKDKRQGLHGREFNCLKFRTMVTGAHAIQEKLRAVSQVDGPQFKMADDPRISTVGWFLRETYIDEIPQFFNVLLGQMSVVGPRPSPESENTLCPFWRDARLSVRPGITGLWQLFRTRQPMRDFQEWIHYDVEYVRNLSLKMDLWICWQTAKKLFDNFISQF